MILGWAFFVLVLVLLLFVLGWMTRTAGVKVVWRMEASSLMDTGEGKSVTEFQAYVTTPEAAFALGRRIETLHKALHDGMESLHS